MTYAMAFNGGIDGTVYSIGFATSSDGVAWTKGNGGLPALTPSASGWDDASVKDPCLVPPGPLYYLYYTGRTGSYATPQVGLAISADGRAWRKVSGNPVLPIGTGSEFDAGGCTFPHVVHDTADANPAYRWKMWYAGISSGGVSTIGYAYSGDGVHWTKSTANPVVSPSLAYDTYGCLQPVSVLSSGTWYVFYAGSAATGNPQDMSVCLATCTDPQGAYTKSAGNPLLSPSTVEMALTAGTSSGSNVFTVASTTGFAVGDPVLLLHGTAVQSTSITALTSTTITTAVNADVAYTTSDTIRSFYFGSVSPQSIIDIAGTWYLYGAAFQQFAGAPFNECSFLATSTSLGSGWTFDRAAGQLLPHGTTWDTNSDENPSVIAGYTAPAFPGTLWVPNKGSATVTPIDTATSAAGTAVTVGTNPFRAVPSPDGTMVAVSNYGSNTVDIISTSTNTVTHTITTGSGPDGLAWTPDGTKLLVLNYNAGTMQIVTTSTWAIGTAFDVSNGTGSSGQVKAVCVDPAGTYAYVAAAAGGVAGFVCRVTIATQVVVYVTTGTEPGDVSITPDGTYVVTNSGNDADVGYIPVSAFASPSAIAVGYVTGGVAVDESGNTWASLQHGEIIGVNTKVGVAGSPLTIATTTDSLNGVAITPDGATAYVADGTAGTVYPVTLGTQTAGTAITVGTTPTFGYVTPDQAPTASFTQAATGLSVAFTDTSTTPKGTVARWLWDFGDGTYSSDQSPTHLYTAAGTYTVTLTVTNSAGTSTSQTWAGRTAANNGGSSATDSQSVTVTAAASTAGFFAFAAR